MDERDHLYIVGGQQRELRPLSAGDDWYEYQKGIVLDLDVRSGQATSAFEYISPPDVTPDEGATILFKSGTYRDGRLYLCTQTEVMVLGLPDFQRLAYVSLPIFNDVHHVLPTPQGTMLVASTGLDMVVELTYEGDVLSTWNVLGEDPWTRFDKSIDYRKVRTTKPHLAHPNHVFMVGAEIWATRFQQRDAICLTSPGKRIHIGLERIHDGVLHDGLVYFTTVNGRIVIADPIECRVTEVIDLNLINDGETQLGWCRGIALDPPYAWIGFSRIRPTKFRENVGWVMRGFKRDFGTHVARYDLVRKERLDQVNVEPFGLSAVFGIFRAVGAEARSVAGAAAVIGEGATRDGDEGPVVAVTTERQP